MELRPTQPGQKLSTVTCDFIHIKLNSIIGMLFSGSLRVQLIDIDKPSITSYSKKKSTAKQKTIAEAIKEMQNSMFDAFSQLHVQKALIRDASVKIFPPGDDGSYFGLNHITLNFSDIQIEKATSQDSAKFHIEGEITIDKPDVHLIDSTVSVQLGSVRASSARHNLVIDSLQFNHINNNGQPELIKFSTLRIVKFNWPRFLNESVFELDSVVVAKGSADISLLQTKKSNKPAKAERKQYSGNSFIIHYASVSDVSYELETKDYINKQNKMMLMKLQGDSFMLKELSLINGRQPALDVQEFKIKIRNFQENNENNTYTFTLGDIAVNNHTLVIKDYLLQANKGSKFGIDNKVLIPELRLENYSLSDLMQKRLIASRLTVVNPEIVIDILEKSAQKKHAKKDINSSIQQLMASLSTKLSLGEIVVENAAIKMLPQAAPNDEFKISGLSIVVNGEEALQSNSFTDILHSIKKFTTSGFNLSSAKMNFKVNDVRLLNQPRGLYFGSIAGNAGPNAQLDLKGVTLLNETNTLDISSADGLNASDLLVESGSISITKPTIPPPPKAVAKTPPPIRVKNLNLQNIKFQLHENGKLGASAGLNLNAIDFMFANNTVYWSTLNIAGTKPAFNTEAITFNAGNMQIVQPGTFELTNPTGELNNTNTHIAFNAEQLRIGVGLSSTNIPELKVQDVYLNKPKFKIEITQHPKTVAENKTAKPFAKNISLESLSLDEPAIDFMMKKSDGKLIQHSFFYTGHLNCKNLQLSNENNATQVKVASVDYETQHVNAEVAEKLFSPSSLRLQVSNLLLNPATKKISLMVDTAMLTDISNTIIGKKKDTISFHIAEVGISHFPYSTGNSIKPIALLTKHNWWTKGANLIYNTEKQKLQVDGLSFEHNSKYSFAFDSMQMRSQFSRDSFWMAQPFEKDYMTLSTGKTYSNNLNLNFANNKPIVDIGSLFVNNLVLIPERDKRRPEDTVSYRPLLAKQIMGIPLSFKIDTIALQDATVRYNEIAKKSGGEGVIFFHNISGYVLNAKTYDVRPNDTLRIRLRVNLYGKGALQLGFRQSYHDSLQGFWMGVRMGKFTMAEMNKLLQPQMGLRINSGQIDSLLLLVNGNDHFAYGTMDLRYHSMNVRLMGQGGKEKYFGANTINWLANQILRRHDNGKPNLVFKERVKKRGQFNFWGKIAVEGLLTNIGVKSDKKEKKNFKKNLKQYKLPENYWEE